MYIYLRDTENVNVMYDKLGLLSLGKSFLEDLYSCLKERINPEKLAMLVAKIEEFEKEQKERRVCSSKSSLTAPNISPKSS